MNMYSIGEPVKGDYLLAGYFYESDINSMSDHPVRFLGDFRSSIREKATKARLVRVD